MPSCHEFSKRRERERKRKKERKTDPGVVAYLVILAASELDAI
jgi:hypothetical protein